MWVCLFVFICLYYLPVLVKDLKEIGIDRRGYRLRLIREIRKHPSIPNWQGKRIPVSVCVCVCCNSGWVSVHVGVDGCFKIMTLITSLSLTVISCKFLL